MARLRPFRGLRYTDTAGDLTDFLAPPARFLTPGRRESYANRSPYNATAVAMPEGHGDDRSKFVRYARAAAKLAEWRREGVLSRESTPSFYRLTQYFGTGPSVRTSLLALVEADSSLIPVVAVENGAREDRLRLLEATQTAFEAATGLYEDPDGMIAQRVKDAAASQESGVTEEGVGTKIERIDGPDAVAALVQAFAGVKVYLAEGVEGYEAASAFGGGSPTFVSLASLDDPAYVRIAAHRVLRRLPEGREAALLQLAALFDIEEHHNRNLIVYLDRLNAEGETGFGMATEGGLGYLLRPRTALDVPASAWLQREVFEALFGVRESDPNLLFSDPVQAIRAADEGAAAAFILPRPERTDVLAAKRGILLPANAAQAIPAVPTGLVYAPLGDDA